MVRVSDEKVVKTISKVSADSTHPLPAGDYKIIVGHAAVNYQGPVEASAGIFTVTGGETETVSFGALVFKVAEALEKELPIESISVRDSESGTSLRQRARSRS